MKELSAATFRLIDNAFQDEIQEIFNYAFCDANYSAKFIKLNSFLRYLPPLLEFRTIISGDVIFIPSLDELKLQIKVAKIQSIIRRLSASC